MIIQIILKISMLALVAQSFVNDDRTSAAPDNRPTAQPAPLLKDIYPPKKAVFSHDWRKNDRNSNPDWAKLTLVEQATYINNSYKNILETHGLSDIYKPSALTCLTMNETFRKLGRSVQIRRDLPKNNVRFNPLHKTPDRRSSSAGVTNLTKILIDDIFRRSPQFRSRVEGFENIRSGPEFHNKMAGSLMAQMEMTTFAVERKRQDFPKSEDGAPIPLSQQALRAMGNYYGHRDPICRMAYSSVISRCSACIERAGIKRGCLDLARMRGKARTDCN